MFCPAPSRTSTQLWGFGFLPPSNNIHSIAWRRSIQPSSSWSMQWIAFHPSFPPPPPSHSRCCLDRWSAGTGCAAFHWLSSSLHHTISSARTHDCFPQSFHLSKSFHYPSIYFWRATISPSNSSNSSYFSSSVGLGVPVSQVPCTPSSRVNSFLSRLPYIQPASSAPVSSESQYVPKRRSISVTRYGHRHLASSLAPWDCSTLVMCARAKLPIWTSLDWTLATGPK